MLSSPIPHLSFFLDLIDSFNLIQSVKGATHSKGHTLDLVLSSALSLSLSLSLCLSS